MPSHLMTRRSFSARLAALVPGTVFAGSALRPRAVAGNVSSSQDDGITHNSDAIHQVITFKGSPARVYAMLTEAARFDQVIRQSEAMKAGMPPGAPRTAISTAIGGAFTLFGGQITGRQLELVPSQRVVQAWRAGSWPAGSYSIVRFELSPAATGCQLVFDHTGFPAGEAQHLALGWHANYWTPMARVLG